MGKKFNQAKIKRRTNAAYAARFPRRDKEAKREARKERVAERELRWLEQTGIERDPRHPLVLG